MEGRADEGHALLVRAHVLAGESKETRVWVLRAWIEQGRLNDAMDGLQALLEEAPAEPTLSDIHYALGMAFHARAEAHLRDGVPTRTVRSSFEPAIGHLELATEQQPGRYREAHAALARALWFLERGPQALRAAERALELAPEDASTHYLLSQVLFSLYLTADRDGAKERAADLYEEALAGYRSTLELLAGEENADGLRLRARTRLALAHLLLWRSQRGEACELIAAAIADDPQVADYAALVQLTSEEQERLLGRELEEALRAGSRAFRERSPGSSADAELDWWIGYLTHERGRRGTPDLALLGEAESFLLDAVAKRPDFHNAWYYAGNAAYLQGEYARMVSAFESCWRVEPASLVAELSRDAEHSLRVLDWVVGWCARSGRAQDAALLCEVRVAVDSGRWEYWNDLGLFSRDAGRELLAALEAAEDPGRGSSTTEEAVRARATALWERALQAYSRARELAPGLPHLLNDRAVVLHYDLGRDLEEARRLYETARDEARALLAAAGEAGAADESELELIRTALEDSIANLAALGEG